MSFDDPTNPATWLLASFLVLVVATNFAWLVGRRHAAEPTYRRGPLAAAGWLCLSLFTLLVPFLALRQGVVSPYALGLAEIDWPATLSNGMVLAGLIVGGLLFGWLVYRRARLEEHGAGLAPDGEPASPGLSLPPALARLLAGLRAPVDAALQQWHWAFYRAAAIAWLMLPLGLPGAPMADQVLRAWQRDPLYWGAWLGIAVAGLEWALDPFARAQLRRSGEREVALRRAALAVATTGLFVLTRNFWLCLAVHVAVETLAVGWFPLRTPSLAEGD